jgi:hypothetical protein
VHTIELPPSFYYDGVHFPAHLEGAAAAAIVTYMDWIDFVEAQS